MFLTWDEGLIADRMWEANDAWFSSIVQRGPGYRRWWETSRHGYDGRFQAHVDEAFERRSR